LIIDLNEYFNDKDDDALAYSALELKTNDLEVSLENSILTVNNRNNVEVKEAVEHKEKKVLEEEKKIIEEEEKLEEDAQKSKISGTHSMGKPKEVPAEAEVQQAVKKEEEKKLETERIEKEKELEKIEAQKEEVKSQTEIQQPSEPKPETTDEKVKQMVENTKKFVTGTEETATDIIEDVKKEEAQEAKKEEELQEKKKEEKIEEPKQEKAVPSAHDLKQQKETEEKKEDTNQKEIEDLAKELIKKGTLRKK